MRLSSAFPWVRPTGMQVLLLIIDTSFFPQTPGKWHYSVNRNFTPGFLTPGICQFCLMAKFTLSFILYEVLVYTSILEISLHKSKVCATFHCAVLKTTGKYFTVPNSVKKAPFVNLKIRSGI
jgi:hypothetical protein